MRMIKIITALILVFALIISCFAAPAQASVMTAAALGAGLIAVAAAAGAIYSSAQQSQASLQAWASDRIDGWLGGRSIAEVFGSEYIRMAHGKLIIPAVIYNAINEMINDDVTQTGAVPGGAPHIIYGGSYYDKIINLINPVPDYIYPPVIHYEFDTAPSASGLSVIYNNTTHLVQVYGDGVLIQSFTMPWGDTAHKQQVSGGYMLYKQYATDTTVRMRIGNTADGSLAYYYATRLQYPLGYGDVELTLDRTWEKDVCDVGYQWEGSISGSEADTNIDDLIDTIFKEAAQDTITVEGTIEGETPYPPQPTTYPIDDILGGMDTINDSINDAGKDVTDAIGSVVDGIHSQTGAINDAADAVSDKVQSLEDTLVDALDVPTTAEASGFKWDLSQLFPFCIPFDIAAMYQAFDGVAAAPNISIPIVIPSFGFSYTMQLDFSPFNGVAAILRQVELIAFGLALAWGTSKVIRW